MAFNKIYYKFKVKNEKGEFKYASCKGKVILNP